NACEGARSGPTEAFSSTAATLVRKGVPAVVAMQYPISDSAAIEFSCKFYEELAQGTPVDAALTEARIAMSMARRDSIEWGTPTLFMHAPNGVLFDLKDSPVPEVVHEPLPVDHPKQPAW